MSTEIKNSFNSRATLKSGSKTYTMRLSHKAKRVVSRFHGGTLTLWLFVKSNDGQQQTVSRVLNLRV